MNEVTKNLAIDIANSLIEDLSTDNLRLTNRLARLVDQNGELSEEIDRLKAEIMELSWTNTVVKLGIGGKS